jgi:hypothetical protein
VTRTGRDILQNRQNRPNSANFAVFLPITIGSPAPLPLQIRIGAKLYQNDTKTIPRLYQLYRLSLVFMRLW